MPATRTTVLALACSAVLAAGCASTLRPPPVPAGTTVPAAVSETATPTAAPSSSAVTSPAAARTPAAKPPAPAPTPTRPRPVPTVRPAPAHTRPAPPAPRRTQAPPPPAPSVYYANCAAARAAGAAPLLRGEPGYRPGLDRDGDGIACE